MVKITSVGAGAAWNPVGVTPNVLNRFEFDLNLYAEPSIQIEVRDQLTLQLLYTGKLDNVGAGLHKLDISFTPMGGMADFRIVVPGATNPMGVEIDNFILTTPTTMKTQIYLEDFSSLTTGTWSGSGAAVLTYDVACGCMKIQTSANQEAAQDQVVAAAGGQEFYLSMDIYTDLNVATQIDVLDALTLRPLTSRILVGVNGAHRITASFNSLSGVFIKATRVSAPGIATFRIDNIEVSDYQHFLSSIGGLNMTTTTDYSEWSATGGLADFKTYLEGNYKMEIRDHNASYVSTTMNTVQGQATELTFDLERRGTISGSVAVVVINPANNGTLASQMVSVAGLSQLILNFTPPGTTVELRLYNPGDYALIDNLHLKYDRVVYHTICDNSKDYRFGFNGQEKDNEKSGLGNTLVFEYRIHDTRLGRFLSVDPLEKEYPWNSTYAFAENKVIRCLDLEGKEALDYSVAFNFKYTFGRPAIGTQRLSASVGVGIIAWHTLAASATFNQTSSGLFSSSAQEINRYMTLALTAGIGGIQPIANQPQAIPVKIYNSETVNLFSFEADFNRPVEERTTIARSLVFARQLGGTNSWSRTVSSQMTSPTFSLSMYGNYYLVPPPFNLFSDHNRDQFGYDISIRNGNGIMSFSHDEYVQRDSEGDLVKGSSFHKSRYNINFTASPPGYNANIGLGLSFNGRSTMSYFGDNSFELSENYFSKRKPYSSRNFQLNTSLNFSGE